MGTIYKITNKINNKVYIGQTVCALQKRWREHCREATNTSVHRPLYDAMRYYGVENFCIESIEVIDNTLLNEREKFWIKFYNSCIDFPNSQGYNVTLGGDGGSLTYFSSIEVEQIIAYYKTYKSIHLIQQTFHHSSDTIHRILVENNIPIQPCICPVIQFNKQGQILNHFNSYMEAQRQTGVRNSHISECCQGKRKTAGGFIWKRFEE